MSGGADPQGTVDALLERARSGDAKAREELFELARNLVGTWASQRLRERWLGLSRPSDIAQDTSFQAFIRFDSFKGTTGAEWESWLQTIFRNCAAQSLRAAWRKKRDDRGNVPLDDSEVTVVRSGQPSPSEVTATKERWRELMAQIFELPEEHKQAISLVHFKALPVAEAAKRMGKSEAAIGGLLQRGIKTLRERMTGKDPSASLPITVEQEAATALLVYLERRGREGEIDVAGFLTEYPACAGELREMIDWTERIRALHPTSVRRD
jgi:RNA polymerase sigma-70 factor, ECF subfamily